MALFQGLKIKFGPGISERRIEIFSRNIKNCGGQIVSFNNNDDEKIDGTNSKKKVFSLFQPKNKKKIETKTIDFNSITDIVCGNDVTDIKNVAAFLKVSKIPSTVSVLKVGWIEDSFEKKTLVNKNAYTINETMTLKRKPDAQVIDLVIDDGDSTINESPKRRKLKEKESTPAGNNNSNSNEPSFNFSKNGRWEEICDGSVLHFCSSAIDLTNRKLAIFDMDGCLIETKSGKTFPIDANDWKFFGDSAFTKSKVQERLRELTEDGYRLVILSNQSGIGKGKVPKEQIQTKVSNIIANLQLPIQAFLAIEDNNYRKPRIGIWKLLTRGLNVNPDTCLFVGDAAGRPKEGKRKKDFDDTDIKFAINCKMPFQTPEQLFLLNKNSFHNGERLVNLIEHPINSNVSVVEGDVIRDQIVRSYIEPQIELILLVGCQASGKSFFCEKYFPSYHRVNQDILKTKEKCKQFAINALKEGKSVIVDNTNRSIALRREWIQLGRSLELDDNLSIRCIHLNYQKDFSFHLNKFRYLNPEGVDRRKMESVTIHSFHKQLEVPSDSEGFDIPVDTVNKFAPGPFKSQQERDLFMMHL